VGLVRRSVVQEAIAYLRHRMTNTHSDGDGIVYLLPLWIGTGSALRAISCYLHVCMLFAMSSALTFFMIAEAELMAKVTSAFESWQVLCHSNLYVKLHHILALYVIIASLLFLCIVYVAYVACVPVRINWLLFQ
jgi:hypothetical protein